MVEEQPKTILKKKRFRSIAYPSIGIEAAIQDAEKLRTSLGDGPYSRLVAVQALGYYSISGASAPRIAALVHFGLLERIGNTYKQSQLAARILLPQSEEDKKIAILEATKTPKIYRRLINDYNGKSIPALLSNVLFHNYSVNERVVKELAKNFTHSLEFSGILNNGVVVDQENGLTPEGIRVEQPGVFTKNDGKNSKPGRSVAGKTMSGGIQIPLGDDIIVNLSEKLAIDLAKGKFGDKFSKALESLEKSVKEEKNSVDVPDTGLA